MLDWDFESGGKKFWMQSYKLDPYYGMSGKIASAWAHIEFTMDTLIAQMVEGSPSLAHCVTTQLNGIGPRVRALVALLRIRGAPTGKNTLVGELKAYETRSYELVKIRNRAVHDLWTMREDGIAHQFCVAVDGELKFGLAARDLAEMEKDYNRIHDYRVEFIFLRDKIRGWLKTLPETWRQGLHVLTIGDLQESPDSPEAPLTRPSPSRG